MDRLTGPRSLHRPFLSRGPGDGLPALGAVISHFMQHRSAGQPICVLKWPAGHGECISASHAAARLEASQGHRHRPGSLDSFLMSLAVCTVPSLSSSSCRRRCRCQSWCCLVPPGLPLALGVSESAAVTKSRSHSITTFNRSASHSITTFNRSASHHYVQSIGLARCALYRTQRSV